MFDWIRTRILRGLRVPATPEPPAGAPGSVRVFRAGVNFYKFRLLGWGITQAFTLAGILFSLWFIHSVQLAVANRQAAARNAPAQTATTPPQPSLAPPATEPPSKKKSPAKSRSDPRESPRQALERLAERTPLWLFYVFALFEAAGLAIYFAQVLITYAALRLDYEQRWYIVTDRSLRLRSGLWQVQELTMSFANLQQVSVSQGPVQRLLGLADVRVQTAGGGGDARPGQHANSLHTAEFHSVDNAAEIRDLILDRLRQFRATGLGDPDDLHRDHLNPPAAPAVPPGNAAETLAAAQGMLAEARALRSALASISRR